MPTSTSSSGPRPRTSRTNSVRACASWSLDLPEEHPVRQYADEKMELLDRLGHASSKAADSRREPQTRPGWSELPSSAPADEPLPRR